MERVPKQRRCRGCGEPWYELEFNGAFERTFHALPVGRRKQWVVLHGHEQYCRRCGKTLSEPIPFADGKRRYLRAFGRYVVELCCVMTLLSVCRLLGVCWDVVKEIHKEYLGKRLKKRRLSKVRYIAVDEFAIHKGHKYMTTVLDLETGEIIHAHEGKDAEALIPFLKQLRHQAYGFRDKEYFKLRRFFLHA